MADSTHLAGKVVALWRYPIKSMQGEQVPVALLAQGSLPADLGILRTAPRHTQAKVGVYASVLHGGTMRRGDAIRVE